MHYGTKESRLNQYAYNYSDVLVVIKLEMDALVLLLSILRCLVQTFKYFLYSKLFIERARYDEVSMRLNN